MGSAFDQLCTRYSGTITPSAPTANRLWDTEPFNICMALDGLSLTIFASVLSQNILSKF